MKLIPKGIELIKYYEGFSSTPYICPGSANTIGYGHVIKSNEILLHITQEEAEKLLLKDLERVQKEVRDLVIRDLNPNQFSALISFTYNLGSTNLRDSTLLKKVNNNLDLEVPEQFIRWIYADGKKLMGLLRRRVAEANLYLE